jgi:CRP/FNR family transcriptional regulator
MTEVALPLRATSSADAWYVSPALVAPQRELRDLFDLLRIDAGPVQDELAAYVDVRRVRKGGALFHEGAAVERLHFIRTGTFKVFHTDADGYEQVLGFAGRGGVLGLDALGLENHPTTAVALEDSTILHVDAHGLRILRQRCPNFDAAMERLLSAQLTQLSDLAELMAAVAAEVRLARFLLQLSTRMRRQGESGSRLLLRMSRRDIASYLGVAIETVSRSFALLAQEGYLVVEKRDIEIIDIDGLKDCARATRTSADRASRGLLRRARLAAAQEAAAAPMFA